MPSPESVNESREVPEVLLKYEKWWSETFGAGKLSSEEYEKLVGFTLDLAKSDQEFKDILSQNLTEQFLDSKDGLEDQNKRRWAMITALSTYGKKFGLKVD